MTAPAPNPKDTPMTLDQKIRQHRALDHVLTRPVADDAWHQAGAAVLAVLDLHPAVTVSTGATYCDRCVDSYEDPMRYPCPNVAAIATALGIDLAAVTG